MEDATQDKATQLVLIQTAIKQAMFEVVGENRPEIIKRASAKLAAMGIKVSEAEMGGAG